MLEFVRSTFSAVVVTQRSGQQPHVLRTQAILDLFEKMNALLAEKKHFQELGADLDARLEHAEFQVRVRAFRAQHQPACETLQTVNEPPAFLQTHFVEVDASLASLWAAVLEKTTTSKSCSRTAPCTWLKRIGLWMQSLLAQSG